MADSSKGTSGGKSIGLDTLAGIETVRFEMGPDSMPEEPRIVRKSLGIDEGVAETLTSKPPDKYKFRKSIGQGGMKTVLQVRDCDTMRDVAMAVLPDVEHRPKVDMLRFIQEARITASLEHPNIVPVHDIGVDASGSPYFTMKLLKGETFASVLKKLEVGDPDYLRDYDLERLLRIFLKVCSGVAFAHSKGVLHLDVKPENIQIGDFGEVLILDWGLAKVQDSADDELHHGAKRKPSGSPDMRLTMDGVMKGTPGYMAPEQAAGRNSQKDCRTDIYALGGLLYAILTYKDPIESKDVKDMVRDTLDGHIVPPSVRVPGRNMPGAIEAVIRKAMAVNPDERYDSVQSLRDEVYAFIGGYATVAEKATPFKKAMLFAKRHKIILSSLVIIILLSVSFGSYALYELSRQRSGWIPVFKEDFSSPGDWQKELMFMDSSLKKEVEPWRLDDGDGLKMSRGEWIWLRNVKVQENVRLVVKVSCGGNPDALEICLNSRIEPVETWWYVPTGYSFQFAGFGGSKDIVFKNENAFAPEVITAVESKVNLDETHTVVFQREDEKLSMSVDGREVLEASDMFPPIGAHLESVGLRTYSSSMRLFSIEVFRLALPEKASPLVAGDVLVEAQHFKEAIEKYVTIAENYGRSPLAETALTKAYITATSKLKEPDERNRILIDIKKSIASRFPDFSHREQILEMDALMHWKEQRYKEALATLSELFELNPNTSVVPKLLQFPHQPLEREIADELFTWIQKTRNLKRLDISNLGLDTVKPLAGIPLIYLDCSNNSIASLAGLDGMRLEVLSCQRNKIGDLEALREMPLKSLNCQENSIKDISPLQGMPLKDINCSWNGIGSLEPLKGMQLERLSFSGNQVSDLEPLRGMPLKMLDVSKNQVESIDALQGMPIEILSLASTKVKDISPLEGMPLTILELHGCEILHDIGPLFSSTTLERLSIPDGVNDITMLRSLPSLKYLSNKSASLFGTAQETVQEFWEKYDADRKSRSSSGDTSIP